VAGQGRRIGITGQLWRASDPDVALGSDKGNGDFMIAAERGITQPRHVDLAVPGHRTRRPGVPMLHIEIPPGSNPPGGRKSLRPWKGYKRFDVEGSSPAAAEVL
jgi:hypothetical protein